MRSTNGAGRIQIRVAESLAADLRDRILRGRIPDGPLPKQDDLMAEYGVSGPRYVKLCASLRQKD